MLETREISHRFGDNLVLNRVSFRVGEGEIHALLGPNGAGKTTLIRILAGLLHPTVGIVNVTGFEPRANARLFRQQIGFVPSGDRTFYLRISASRTSCSSPACTACAELRRSDGRGKYSTR